MIGRKGSDKIMKTINQLDTKEVKNLLLSPQKENSNLGIRMVSYPYIKYQNNPSLKNTPFQYNFYIETSLCDTDGTCIDCNLWYNQESKSWYLGDTGECLFAFGAYATDDILPKATLKHFKEAIRDAQQFFHVVRGNQSDLYFCKLNKINDLPSAYRNIVNFQMYYLNVLAFLLGANTGVNAKKNTHGN